MMDFIVMWAIVGLAFAAVYATRKNGCLGFIFSVLAICLAIYLIILVT